MESFKRKIQRERTEFSLFVSNHKFLLICIANKVSLHGSTMLSELLSMVEQ